MNSMNRLVMSMSRSDTFMFIVLNVSLLMCAAGIFQFCPTDNMITNNYVI